MDRELEFILKMAVNTFPKLDIINLLHETKHPLTAEEMARKSNRSLQEVKDALADLIRQRIVRNHTPDGTHEFHLTSDISVSPVLKKLAHHYRSAGKTEINQRLHDFHIGESIKVVLDASDKLYAGNIKVAAFNSKVYITGTVNMSREIDEADIVVRHFKDRLFIHKISNQLALSPLHHDDDKFIAVKVYQEMMMGHERYRQENAASLYKKVEVEVIGRVAYIEGLCNDKHKSNAVAGMAYRVEEIIHVVNYMVEGFAMDDGKMWQG
ncbi:MAG: BON domain-containing protein [bacterium]|nr:BON domain-containing protein [bacterium]